MKRSLVGPAVVFAMLTAACGANGDDSSEEGDTRPTTTRAAATSSEFGTLGSPCGHDVDGKVITLAADEAGTGTDKLYIGVANDRSAEARPGLLQELYDSTLAFASWCNRQGGIGGLEVVPVDLDGKLFKIEAAMTTACGQVFAMVGGGYAQDNQVFTGKDGSDFHRCKMIAFPGFAVSTDFADANGVVQALPNHGYRRSKAGIEALAELYPEEVERTTSVYGEGLESVRISKDQNREMMELAGGYGFVDDVSYQLLNQDYSLTAEKVVDVDAATTYYVGEPENWASTLGDLQIKGYEGISYADANQYDQRLFSRGPEAPEGALVSLPIHPFEEADEWPATKQWLDLMQSDGPPDAQIAALGVYAFSAGLLFATAVNNCATSTGGAVSRACVVQEGQKISAWDGGGLHTVVDLSGKSHESCVMIVQAKDGEFVRRFPERGSRDDDRDGFHCYPDGVVELHGNYGQGNVDPSLPY